MNFLLDERPFFFGQVSNLGETDKQKYMNEKLFIFSNYILAKINIHSILVLIWYFLTKFNIFFTKI